MKSFVGAIMANLGPCSAVHRAYALNVQIDPAWMATAGYLPVHVRHAELEKQNLQEAAFYRGANIGAWQQEHNALKLIAARKDVAERFSPADHAIRVEAEREAIRAADRQRLIAERAAALYDEHAAQLRERFAAQAAAEINPTPVTVYETPKRKRA